MIDIPIHETQIVQEYVVNESTIFQASNEAFYQMSEVDLSFSDSLACTCSGESSSGPTNRRKANAEKKLV